MEADGRKEQSVSSGTVIITGASQGIGAATAILAGEAGYSVCVNYRKNESAAEEIISKIRDKGAEAVAVAADVSAESDVESLFRLAEDQLGPIAGLVNNAGILEAQSDFLGLDAERFLRILTTNVIGCFLCSKEAVRRMAKSRGGSGGSIVNVSSGAAQTGSPNEYIDYAASKGAVDTMTIGLAREVAADGIRVNAVRPGFILTDMHAKGGEPDRVERLKGSIPLRRGGKPEEVAKAILWLLSDEASYSTGTFIEVTGGM